MFQTVHEISKNLIFVFVWKYVWKYVNINVSDIKKKKKNIKGEHVLAAKTEVGVQSHSACSAPVHNGLLSHLSSVLSGTCRITQVSKEMVCFWAPFL